MRLLNFKPRLHHTVDLFFESKILTVHELFVYDLMKFVIRASRKEHSSDFLNKLFQSTRVIKYATRYQTAGLVDQPFCRINLMKHSLKNRGIRLLNLFNNLGISQSVLLNFNFKTQFTNIEKR